MTDKYGHNRLEAACERVLSFGSSPNIRNISTILKNGQDRLSPIISKVESKGHGITRGATYYKKGIIIYRTSHPSIVLSFESKLTPIFRIVLLSAAKERAYP